MNYPMPVVEALTRMAAQSSIMKSVHARYCSVCRAVLSRWDGLRWFDRGLHEDGCWVGEVLREET